MPSCLHLHNRRYQSWNFSRNKDFPRDDSLPPPCCLVTLKWWLTEVERQKILLSRHPITNLVHTCAMNQCQVCKSEVNKFTRMHILSLIEDWETFHISLAIGSFPKFLRNHGQWLCNHISKFWRDSSKPGAHTVVASCSQNSSLISSSLILSLTSFFCSLPFTLSGLRITLEGEKHYALKLCPTLPH